MVTTTSPTHPYDPPIFRLSNLDTLLVWWYLWCYGWLSLSVGCNVLLLVAGWGLLAPFVLMFGGYGELTLMVCMVRMVCLYFLLLLGINGVVLGLASVEAVRVPRSLVAGGAGKLG